MKHNFSMNPLFKAVSKHTNPTGRDYAKPMVAPETIENIRRWGVCQQHLVKANKGVYNLH